MIKWHAQIWDHPYGHQQSLYSIFWWPARGHRPPGTPCRVRKLPQWVAFLGQMEQSHTRVVQPWAPKVPLESKRSVRTVYLSLKNNVWKQQSDRKICNHLTPHSGTKRDQNRLELQARAYSDCALLIRISLNISFTQNSCFASLYKSSRRVLVARLKNYPSRRYRLLHTLITSNTNN